MSYSAVFGNGRFQVKYLIYISGLVNASFFFKVIGYLHGVFDNFRHVQKSRFLSFIFNSCTWFYL